MRRCRTFPALLLASATALAGGLLAAGSTHAQAPQAAAAQASADQRPYDDKLMRLSEVLGAVHYLRELCGANDGQLWRDRMREVLEADRGSALRRVRLTKSFNHGYRSYRRSYTVCNANAQTVLGKFLAEGAQLSSLLAREAQ
jgi:uncharacterized protein (TIGR02301 family)